MSDSKNKEKINIKTDLREEIRELRKQYKKISSEISNKNRNNKEIPEKSETFNSKNQYKTNKIENNESENILQQNTAEFLTFNNNNMKNYDQIESQEENIPEKGINIGFYKQKIENLRNALNDAKNQIKNKPIPKKFKKKEIKENINEKIPNPIKNDENYAKTFENYFTQKPKCRNNDQKFETITFNTNIVFNKKDTPSKKPVENKSHNDISEQFIDSVLIQPIYKEQNTNIDNKSLDISELEIKNQKINDSPNLKKSSQIKEIINENYKSLEISKNPEKSQISVVCDDEIEKLRTLRQSINEIKSQLKDFSKEKISLNAFDDPLYCVPPVKSLQENIIPEIKNEPSKPKITENTRNNKQKSKTIKSQKLRIRPKSSIPIQKITENESILAFKNYHTRKTKLNRPKSHGICKKCINLLHQGLSIVQCPKHK